jgi:hypothetical protein
VKIPHACCNSYDRLHRASSRDGPRNWPLAFSAFWRGWIVAISMLIIQNVIDRSRCNIADIRNRARHSRRVWLRTSRSCVGLPLRCNLTMLCALFDLMSRADLRSRHGPGWSYGFYFSSMGAMQQINDIHASRSLVFSS